MSQSPDSFECASLSAPLTLFLPPLSRGLRISLTLSLCVAAFVLPGLVRHIFAGWPSIVFRGPSPPLPAFSLQAKLTIRTVPIFFDLGAPDAFRIGPSTSAELVC